MLFMDCLLEFFLDVLLSLWQKFWTRSQSFSEDLRYKNGFVKDYCLLWQSVKWQEACFIFLWGMVYSESDTHMCVNTKERTIW